MKLFKETDHNTIAALLELDQNNFNNTYAATLEELVGKNQDWADNRYNQWRTVMPFLGSLAVWTLSGKAFSPGNPHVRNSDHSANGGTKVFYVLLNIKCFLI